MRMTPDIRIYQIKRTRTTNVNTNWKRRRAYGDKKGNQRLALVENIESNLIDFNTHAGTKG